MITRVPNSFIRPNSMKFQGLIRPIFIKYQAFFRPLHAKNQALYQCFCVFSPRHLSNNQSPPHNTGLVINMCPVILNNKPYIYLQQLDNLFMGRRFQQYIGNSDLIYDYKCVDSCRWLGVVGRTENWLSLSVWYDFCNKCHSVVLLCRMG